MTMPMPHGFTWPVFEVRLVDDDGHEPTLDLADPGADWRLYTAPVPDDSPYTWMILRMATKQPATGQRHPSFAAASREYAQWYPTTPYALPWGVA
jgi:hypothetical protein